MQSPFSQISEEGLAQTPSHRLVVEIGVARGRLKVHPAGLIAGIEQDTTAGYQPAQG